jgi:hypothetical protein
MSFTHQDIGIIILFITGILGGFWIGFLLGLNQETQTQEKDDISKPPKKIKHKITRAEDIAI